MKKFLCITLALILVLGMCACGGNGEGGASGDSKGLQVGFGRVNITPDYPVRLAGGAATRVSEGFRDLSYITCVAVKSADQTYLICTMDFICAEDLFVDPAKGAMSDASGVPVENILMNATHTHSGVAIRTDGSENVEQYRKDFFAWAAEAAKAAVEDLSPAEVYSGSSETEGLAFVRHYKCSDGTYAGPNFGSFSSGAVEHVGETDTEVQVIRFVRPAEDKKDVVLMSFPAHATMNSSSVNLQISADYPSTTRDHIEANSDAQVAFFIAAAGNQVPSSRISSEKSTTDYQVYGQQLGDYVLKVMENMTKVEGDGIVLKTHTFTGKTMKEGLDRLTEAQLVKAEWDIVGRGTTEGANAAKKHGFSSVYEVSAILERAKTPETKDMELKVMSIGDIGLLFAPYEMFGETGLDIKERSPYDFTFIVTCGEGAMGYLPTPTGFEINSYESHVTDFARGTAEELADTFVNLLTEIKGAE